MNKAGRAIQPFENSHFRLKAPRACCFPRFFPHKVRKSVHFTVDNRWAMATAVRVFMRRSSASCSHSVRFLCQRDKVAFIKDDCLVFRMARAMETRWRCPPAERQPTLMSNSYPCSDSMMNSWALAIFAASITCLLCF